MVPEKSRADGPRCARGSEGPGVTGDAGPGNRKSALLMAEAFQLAGVHLGHAVHAFAGIDQGDCASQHVFPQKWGAGFAIGIRANIIQGAFSCG